MQHKFYKISLNRGRSYIDSLKWLKNKNTAVNKKNSDEKYFQYALTVALNYQNIIKDPQRILKITPFLMYITGKRLTFHHNKKTGKSLI